MLLQMSLWLKFGFVVKKTLSHFVLTIYNGKIARMPKTSLKRFVRDNEIPKENMETFETLSDNNNSGFSLG